MKILSYSVLKATCGCMFLQTNTLLAALPFD
jgi:hypothetical protein